jgi:hypothetical protein
MCARPMAMRSLDAQARVVRERHTVGLRFH